MLVDEDDRLRGLDKLEERLADLESPQSPIKGFDDINKAGRIVGLLPWDPPDISGLGERPCLDHPIGYLALPCIPHPQQDGLFDAYSESLVANGLTWVVLPAFGDGLARLVTPVISQDWAWTASDEILSSRIDLPSGWQVTRCLGSESLWSIFTQGEFANVKMLSVTPRSITHLGKRFS